MYFGPNNKPNHYVLNRLQSVVCQIKTFHNNLVPMKELECCFYRLSYVSDCFYHPYVCLFLIYRLCQYITSTVGSSTACSVLFEL